MLLNSITNVFIFKHYKFHLSYDKNTKMENDQNL